VRQSPQTSSSATSGRKPGQSRDPTLRKYRNRSRHLKGMVAPRAIHAFGLDRLGVGGAWAGNTKDYMHFSSTGG
jgi:hypothetical protein